MLVISNFLCHKEIDAIKFFSSHLQLNSVRPDEEGRDVWNGNAAREHDELCSPD